MLRGGDHGNDDVERYVKVWGASSLEVGQGFVQEQLHHGFSP